MELSGEFYVKAGLDDAWRVLTDIERVAACVPGAELREVEGDEYRGVLQVQAGKVTTQFRGTARLVEVNKKGHRAVLHAEGREVRGKGTAEATLTASLTRAGADTKVKVVAELEVSGRVGQLSADELADASADVLARFSQNLEALLTPARRQRPARQRARTEAADTADAADAVEPADTAPSEAAHSTPPKAPAAPTDGERPTRARRSQSVPAGSQNGRSARAGSSPATHNGAGAKAEETAATTVYSAVAGNGSDGEAGDLEAELVDVSPASLWLRGAISIALAAIILAVIAAWLRRRHHR